MLSIEYYLTYWDNGCWSCIFYSLEKAYKFITDNDIIHYDLVDNRGVVYHAIF